MALKEIFKSMFNRKHEEPEKQTSPEEQPSSKMTASPPTPAYIEPTPQPKPSKLSLKTQLANLYAEQSLLEEQLEMIQFKDAEICRENLYNASQPWPFVSAKKKEREEARMIAVEEGNELQIQRNLCNLRLAKTRREIRDVQHKMWGY